MSGGSGKHTPHMVAMLMPVSKTLLYNQLTVPRCSLFWVQSLEKKALVHQEPSVRRWPLWALSNKP